jgi:hypothetical protein
MTLFAAAAVRAGFERVVWFASLKIRNPAGTLYRGTNAKTANHGQGTAQNRRE